MGSDRNFRFGGWRDVFSYFCGRNPMPSFIVPILNCRFWKNTLPAALVEFVIYNAFTYK